MKVLLKLLFVTLLGCHTYLSYGQNIESITPYFTYGKGLSMASQDSLFLMNIRFRMQNRIAFTTNNATDLGIDQVEARVRRLRLRLDGHIYSKKLSYVIQLSFSRGDLNIIEDGFHNIIRDAMVIYQVNEHLAVGVGQTKLPGNRQRVNSSGDLQLVDRSIVNATFNIDRDFGVQGYYTNHINRFYYVLRGAISSGEGRNITSSDNGLAYTGRLELLPLGQFENGGDYFEGDLVREATPKISSGFTYNFNSNAIRVDGQLGNFLYDARDISTVMADFLFKYAGFACSYEYLNRFANDPVTTNENGNVRYVYKGYGQNFQTSYIFLSDLEIIGRYSEISPGDDIRIYEPSVRQYTLGITKYLKGHRLKLQSDVTFERNDFFSDVQADHENWQLRFQIELGI